MYLNVQAGKYYVTRNNRRAFILTTERRNSYPVLGFISVDGRDTVCNWTGVGRHVSQEIEDEHGLDLIKQWDGPPIVDWAAMPSQAQYVAQDKCDRWEWYRTKPRQVPYGWHGEDGGKVPPHATPTYFGPWEDSLVKRPAESD